MSSENGRLSEDKVQRLEFLSGRVWDKLESDWEKGFFLLKSYYEKPNSLSIPEKLVIDGINLFSWAAGQ